MIPKVIHYCWFGGNPLDELSLRCIESWKKYCPDYEIIEWNESNFDVNYNTYTRQAYEKKKYAFVSDVARLKIVYDHGGFYFDTDVEIVRPIDALREHDAFFGMELGRKTCVQVATGLGFGAIQKHALVKELLRDYENREFILEGGDLDITPCPVINTQRLMSLGLRLENAQQYVHNAMIYSTEWFAPGINAYDRKKIMPTIHTYSIHHYNASWLSKREKHYARIKTIIKKLLGKRIAEKIQQARKK